MKAIVLAAGYATRLYPLTLNTPKALLQIGKQTMLDFIVDEIETIGAVNEIIIISNSRFYDDFCKWENNRKSSIIIDVMDDKTTDNTNKLGAIGDIDYVIKKKNINEDILVVVSDNYFTFKLLDFYKFYERIDKDVILVKEIDTLSELQRMGNTILDVNGKVEFMEEKPVNPKSNNAVFASYIYKAETINMFTEYLLEGNNPDAPGFFPSWLYKKKDVYAYKFVGECYDIGTHEAYKEICEKLK